MLPEMHLEVTVGYRDASRWGSSAQCVRDRNDQDDRANEADFSVKPLELLQLLGGILAEGVKIIDQPPGDTRRANHCQCDE